MDSKRLRYLLDYLGCLTLGRMFVGAKSVKGVLALGSRLKKEGYGVTYNLMGEDITDPRDSEKAMATTIELISSMTEENLGNVSCKPTLYGLIESRQKFKKNLERLLHTVVARKIELEIDAENFSTIEDTFHVFSVLASQDCYRDNIRQAVQAHLPSLKDLMARYNMWDKKLRIVKGAGVYEEDKNRVWNIEADIIEQYLIIMINNLEKGRHPFIATVRDISLVQKLLGILYMIMREERKDMFEFQTLYGPLGRGLKRYLLREGYKIRIYIPFVVDWCKDAWIPYGIRRISGMHKIEMVRDMLGIDRITLAGDQRRGSDAIY